MRDVGLGAADDEKVLAFAGQDDRTLVSADTDFGGILAQSGAGSPSVILFRREGGRRPAELNRSGFFRDRDAYASASTAASS